MSNEPNLFDKFAVLMDQNIKGVQYGVYGLAGLGFIIAMRSVRPFKKFVKPSDIPKHFIEKRMRFSGRVVNIKGDRLLVDHYPVLSLPFRSFNDGLPVKIASIRPSTSNAGIWLNTILKGNEINFIPLRVDRDFVEAIVLNKKQDVGQHLVAIGFATAAPLDFKLDKDPIYSKYYKALIAKERRAESTGAGVWQDQKVGLLKRLSNNITNLRYSLI